MTFDLALAQLRDGQFVRRRSWNCSYLFLQSPPCPWDPMIAISLPDGHTGPWIPCHRDLLADDWELDAEVVRHPGVNRCAP